MAITVGVVGDVHLHFDDRDVAQLDARGYDLLLFVGDLAGYGHRGGLRVARHIARLQTPTLVMPGNHDGPSLLALAAEVFPRLRPLRPRLGRGQRARCRALASALGPARLVGYELCPMAACTVLAARPHSCGGRRLAFAPYLREAYGIDSMAASSARLCALIDEAPSDRPLLILAHNGAAGLGDKRGDLCGRDFHARAGDWGDPDLAEALAHAKREGRTITAVLSGHMHHALRGGGQRTWQIERDGTLHVNAARVPRVFEEGEVLRRHHVALTIDEGHARAEQVLL